MVVQTINASEQLVEEAVMLIDTHKQTDDMRLIRTYTLSSGKGGVQQVLPQCIDHALCRYFPVDGFHIDTRLRVIMSLHFAQAKCAAASRTVGHLLMHD